MSLRRAKNGTGGEITLCNKYVYHKWDTGQYSEQTLGRGINKKEWIFEHVKDAEHTRLVNILLADWSVYENGWLVDGDSNQNLFYYKCQIGNCGQYAPEALEYLKNMK